MILQIAPDAPFIVRAAAAAILYAHIGAGFASLASGAVAIVARKGQRIHRYAGNVFFASMLVLTAIGAAVAPFLPQHVSSVAGLLTLYLVATAWVTVRRGQGRTGRFEIAAIAFALVTAALGLWFGWLSMHNALDGEPFVAGYVFAGFALLGAAGDLHVSLSRGLMGPPRMARHVWRMCLALLIATLSFVAQPAAIPAFLKGSPLLYVPLPAVLALTLFWLVRIRFPGAFKPARKPPRRAPMVADAGAH